MSTRPTSWRALSLLLLTAAACGDDGAAIVPEGDGAADALADDVARAQPDTDPGPDVGWPPADASDVPVVMGEPALVAAQAEMPGLSAQDTTRGVRIGSLFPYDGRLYIGYRDFDGNTGPIAVLSLGLAGGDFEASQVLATEEVLRWATLDGALYTADIDPDAHQGEGGAFRLPGSSGTWGATAPIEDAVHTFDVASFDGRLWAATGCSPGAVARVSSSADGGGTWTEEHATAAPDDGGFSRYNFLGPTPTRLFISGRIHYETVDDAQAFAYLYEAAEDAWLPVAGAPAEGLLAPLVLGETIWVAAFSGDPGKKGSQDGFWRLEGAELVPSELPEGIDELVQWHLDDDGRAWLLTSRGEDQSVWRAEPTGDPWVEVITLPATEDRAPFSAVGHADGRLFLGTRAGDLWEIEGIGAD